MFEKFIVGGLVAIASTLSTRQMLDVIDARLAVGDEGSRDLANVLSAVRGIDKPQAEREPIKVVSTAVVRAKAFPLTAASIAAKKTLGWTVAPGNVVRTTGNANDGHFNRHIKQAARALGLTVVTGLK
jgi:hypothetical protein